MIKNGKNTSMQDKEVAQKEAPEGEQFFFSEHQISVYAKTPEEAQKKLEALIKKKK